MKITVFITTWCVPFDQVVDQVHTFKTQAKAVAFINAASKKWWRDNDGARCIREYPDTEAYEPITELGYDSARYELWQGEQLFHAMLDHASYAALNEVHYAGKPLPGYLLTAKITGHWPK